MSKSLIKSFFIYGLTSGLSRFISLLLIPLYVRVFSVAQNGIIDMIQTINQVMLIFGILQIETSLQRYYYELEANERKKMISTVLIFVFSLSILISLLVSLLSGVLSMTFFDTMSYKTEIVIASFIIPILNTSILNFIVLRYNKKSFIFSLITLIQVVLTTSFILLFVFKIGLGIKSVFLGQLIGYFIVVIIQLYFIRNEIGWYFDISLLRKMLCYSIPQFPARIGSESLSRMNRFILVTFLSASSLGLYAIAIKFASAMELVNVAFSMAWVPFVYESLKNEDYKEKFKQMYRYITYIVFFIVILLSLFSEEIITLFTTAEYYQVKFLLPGLFLFYGLFVVKGVVEVGISISKRTIYLTYIYLITAVLNICLLLAGVNLFQIKGVIYALVITNFFLIIFNWYATEKLHPIGFKIHHFIISFALVLVVILFQMNFEIDFLYRLVVALLLVVFLFVLLYQRRFVWKKLLS